jgi:hypothetical protein
MPGLITNYLFGERTFQSLSPNYLKEIIRKYPNAYRMGLQGPDIFFYYLSYYMRTRKNNIYSVLHKKNTGIFLDNLIEYAMALDTDESEVCLSYISGFLCHYALDTHTHPYFRYRVEQDFINYQERQNISFYYRRLETLMDTLLLKRLNHMEPSQLNLEALVCLSKKERRIVSDCLVYALRTTYHYRISRKTILKVIRSVRSTCIFLQSSPLLRQRLLRIIDDRFECTCHSAAEFICASVTSDSRCQCEIRLCVKIHQQNVVPAIGEFCTEIQNCSRLPNTALVIYYCYCLHVYFLRYLFFCVMLM